MGWWVEVVALKILVSESQRPFSFGFETKGLGPGLDKSQHFARLGRKTNIGALVFSTYILHTFKSVTVTL